METVKESAKNKYVYRGTIGILLIIISFLILVVEMFTHSVSTILDQMIFAEHKMQIVYDIVGDKFYGLNTDMHLERSLVVMLVLGILLYISSRKETENLSSTE